MGDGLKSGPRGKIGAECPAGEDPDPSRLQRSRGVRGPWQAAQGNLRKTPALSAALVEERGEELCQDQGNPLRP